MKNSELEKICMSMIAYAGEGKAKLFEAMDYYDNGEKEKSKELLDQAEKYLRKGHEIQFIELMAEQAKGKEIPFNLLLIHGMDILADISMEAELFKRKLKNKFS